MCIKNIKNLPPLQYFSPMLLCVLEGFPNFDPFPSYLFSDFLLFPFHSRCFHQYIPQRTSTQPQLLTDLTLSKTHLLAHCSTKLYSSGNEHDMHDLVQGSRVRQKSANSSWTTPTTTGPVQLTLELSCPIRNNWQEAFCRKASLQNRQ